MLKGIPGATIIADVKASQALFDDIAEAGGKPLMWKTGHCLIKSKMKETGAPLAGEMSGHIFFKRPLVRLRRRALRRRPPDRGHRPSPGKSLTEIMDGDAEVHRNAGNALPGRREPEVCGCSTKCSPRLSGSGARVDATDGARVMTDDGWWLLRASNTQDVLVARAEARDEEGLKRLMSQIDEQLAQSGVERTEGDGH